MKRLMAEAQTQESKVMEDFFRGNRIFYDATVGKITTRLALKNEEKSGWKHGFDYLCLADLSFEWDYLHNNKAGRSPRIEWHPAYFHVQDASFGGLFKDMHRYAEHIVPLLTHSVGEESPDINEVRRCFYVLEDKVKAEFDNPEFRRHFLRE
jgi:hypothetical protein